MSDTALRSSLIRLAHAKPELRAHLLPLLREAAKTRTFAEARKEIFDHLKKAGWTIAEGLKIPHATNKDKSLRLFFKAQAVYMVAKEQDRLLGMKEARSIHIDDLRQTNPAEFMRVVDYYAETMKKWGLEGR